MTFSTALRCSAVILLLVLQGISQNGRVECSITAKNLRDAKAPRFERYQAEAVGPFKVAKLDLKSNPLAKMYRTVIRQQMQAGANFARYYRVAVWGCGSSCASFAVVDLRSGKLIVADGVNSLGGLAFEADDFLPGTDSTDVLLRFRKDSRLLVLLGAINDDESTQGAFYYVLRKDRLELVHKTLVTGTACHK